MSPPVRQPRNRDRYAPDPWRKNRVLFDTAADDKSLAKTWLRIVRRMGGRHEHLLGPPLVLAPTILDDRILKPEAPSRNAASASALLTGAIQQSCEHAGAWALDLVRAGHDPNLAPRLRCVEVQPQ